VTTLHDLRQRQRHITLV